MNEFVKKNGITFGVALAAVMLLLQAAMYVIDYKLFANGWISLVRMFIIIGFACVAAIKTKHSLGNFIDFKQAFTAYFITILIGITALTLFVIVLFNLIDPEAKQVITDMVLETQIKMWQSFGMKANEIRESAQKYRESDVLGVWSQLMGLALSIVGYSIVGLIAALILRNKRREY
jgi:Protein of unknown function (DUF4199)